MIELAPDWLLKRAKAGDVVGVKFVLGEGCTYRINGRKVYPPGERPAAARASKTSHQRLDRSRSKGP